MDIIKMSNKHIDECVDLFIDVFTKAPWHDTYSSRKQVVSFFQNYMTNNYFVGYVLKEESSIIALSIGMKKPWINGMEYYIDQFCVSPRFQGKGVGSAFLRETERLLAAEGVRGAVLHTERSFPAYHFYRKNGFRKAEGLAVMYRE